MTDSLRRPEPSFAEGLHPQLARLLLEHTLEHQDPPPDRRVFVNRTLRLEKIRHVGFDLDWTLADYERLPLERLTFELAIERLIDGHGYPEALRGLEFRPDFPRRGLLIDKREGTVLRMNRHRYVGDAYLGRRRLESEELVRLYRQEPIRPSSQRFYHVDSLFELPETNLYSEVVELAVGRPDLDLPSSRRLFEDVRAAIDWVHGHGPLKARVLADPATYLRREPELGLALARLRLGGRRLVLITNSPWDFADGVLSYLLDGLLPGVDSWRQLFDLVLVASAKPAFFREQRPFRQLDAGGEVVGRTRTPAWDGVYERGCLSGLMRRLDCPGEQVLYVGDHIYGDVVRSKLESTWRTALIVKELEEEFRCSAELAEREARLFGLRRRLAELGTRMDRMGDALRVARPATAGGVLDPRRAAEFERDYERLREQHYRILQRTRRLAERVSAGYNPYWGSFFKQGSSKTLFASQLETYACLFTSRVSNFGFYGTHHYFRVLEDPMRHDLDLPG